MMDELSDLEIEGDGAATELELESAAEPAPFEFEPPRRSPVPWLLAALFVVGAAIGGWVWSHRDPPVEPAATQSPFAEPSLPEPEPPAPEPVEPLVLPRLAESDPLIAQWVGALSSHPSLGRWLANEALIERFVAAVDNIAEGKSPRSHLRFAGPAGDFRTSGAEGRLTIDPESYRRYDTLAAIVASLDPEGSATLLRQIEPLLDESYSSLGYPDTRFRDTLFKAMDALLAVPVREEPLELKARIISYELADPALEGLTAAQKHLLRMGPKNIQGIQERLREIRKALTSPQLAIEATSGS